MTTGGHKQPYTEAEDFILLDTPHLTCEQVGRMLGRTARSVQKRRGQLKGREGITAFRVPGLAKGRQHAHPWKVGARPLIAKSCLCCGVLLNSSRYDKYASGRWRERCRRCAQSPQRRRGDVAKARARENQLQRYTADHATRSWAEYTEADMAVISDPAKSLFRMALETGRTLSAVRNARQRYGIADRTPGVPLGDLDEAQWVIRLPQKAAA